MNNCKTAVDTPFIGEGYFLCRYYANNEIDYVLIDNTQKKQIHICTRLLTNLIEFF